MSHREHEGYKEGSELMSGTVFISLIYWGFSVRIQRTACLKFTGCTCPDQ